jgi:putative endonuclease
MKRFFVYLLASERNGTLYIGMTSNLVQRIWQHKNKVFEGFTEHHGVDKLVWYAELATAEAAISARNSSKNGIGPGRCG